MICFIVGSFEGYNRLGLTKFGRNNYKKFYCNYFFRKKVQEIWIYPWISQIVMDQGLKMTLN
jgi:hypothetical protein